MLPLSFLYGQLPFSVNKLMISEQILWVTFCSSQGPSLLTVVKQTDVSSFKALTIRTHNSGDWLGILYSKPTRFGPFKERGGLRQGKLYRMGMCVCAYIYIAWQFKGVYEISVSVGNKVRMSGRERIACNFRLFIVRGVVGGGTVDRRGVWRRHGNVFLR